MLAQFIPVDPSTYQSWPALGVGGCLAAILFFFYRRDVRMYTQQWKGQSDLLMEVVKENTIAITKLIDKMGNN
jgi:predicted Zn-dependent peptidase